MSRFPIDIPKSIQTEKLTSKQWYRGNMAYYLLLSMSAIALIFIAIMVFKLYLEQYDSNVLSLIFAISLLTLNSLFIYSIVNLNSLKRVNGLSRGKNYRLIKKIADHNNWNISFTNQQMTIISFSRHDSNTYYGNQITILYDKKDILLNCISFGSFSSPSPFHWFTNKKKVDKLITEFEKEM